MGNVLSDTESERSYDNYGYSDCDRLNPTMTIVSEVRPVPVAVGVFRPNRRIFTSDQESTYTLNSVTGTEVRDFEGANIAVPKRQRYNELSDIIQSVIDNNQNGGCGCQKGGDSTTVKLNVVPPTEQNDDDGGIIDTVVGVIKDAADGVAEVVNDTVSFTGDLIDKALDTVTGNVSGQQDENVGNVDNIAKELIMSDVNQAPEDPNRITKQILYNILGQRGIAKPFENDNAGEGDATFGDLYDHLEWYGIEVTHNSERDTKLDVEKLIRVFDELNQMKKFNIDLPMNEWKSKNDPRSILTFEEFYQLLGKQFNSAVKIREIDSSKLDQPIHFNDVKEIIESLGSSIDIPAHMKFSLVTRGEATRMLKSVNINPEVQNGGRPKWTNITENESPSYDSINRSLRDEYTDNYSRDTEDDYSSRKYENSYIRSTDFYDSDSDDEITETQFGGEYSYTDNAFYGSEDALSHYRQYRNRSMVY